MSMIPATTPRIVDLAHPAPRAELLGGKAAALARAFAAGHRVPPGVVVTTAATSLTAEELDAAVEALGEGPYAVRSSAVSEDSSSRSFAGQLETLLRVPRGEVVDAVARCRSSANALRALCYGGRAGEVAVLVQRMVPAECAGVAFSADPASGARGVTLIEAVRGLGDRLVSGEADPESWRVSGDGPPRRVRTLGERVLDDAQAMEVSRLARAMEALFGCPQDIEWAFADGALHLLQSRPITALPAAPVAIPVVVPPGDWRRDDHHGVLSPLGWRWFQPYAAAMADSFRLLGMPLKEIRTERIGGHLYLQMVMPGGAPPPRWVLWLASRLVPSLRKANRTAEALLDREGFQASFSLWEREVRPEMRAAIDALFVEDPSTLDDDALLARIRDALALTARGLAHHAALGGPPLFAVGKLALFVEDELRWPMDRAFELLGPCSESTSAQHRAVEAMVREHGDELGDGAAPATWAELLERAPTLGAALAAWQRESRLRVLHYDPKHATVGERPDLALTVLSSVLWARRQGAPDRAEADPSGAALEEARAALPPERFEELKRLLGLARRAYALRDENGVETVSRPSGLLRWFVLELGRRLGSAVGSPEHAVYLDPDEHGPALRGEIPDLAERVERRRGEESWAMRNRGPASYGAAPPEMDLSAFPGPLSRVFRVLTWMERAEAVREEPVSDAPLAGSGIGARVVTGRARVIDRPEGLASLRPGEVLVCRITSPEWSIAHGRVAAIVTDEGGTLSHPAIIAREYGVPAVIGATGATRRIQTGDRLRVDPVAGTVRVMSAG
ncbi:MAG: PEP/pyruvate-binding domain-containing protein [Polyangiales bacterium]